MGEWKQHSNLMTVALRFVQRRPDTSNRLVDRHNLVVEFEQVVAASLRKFVNLLEDFQLTEVGKVNFVGFVVVVVEDSLGMTSNLLHFPNDQLFLSSHLIQGLGGQKIAQTLGRPTPVTVLESNTVAGTNERPYPVPSNTRLGDSFHGHGTRMVRLDKFSNARIRKTGIGNLKA